MVRFVKFETYDGQTIGVRDDTVVFVSPFSPDSKGPLTRLSLAISIGIEAMVVRGTVEEVLEALQPKEPTE